jgi:hypothetical protein
MNKKSLIVSIILVILVVFVVGIFLLKYFNNSNNSAGKQPSNDLSITAIPNPISSTLEAVTPTQGVASGNNPQVPFFAHYYLWWDDSHWQAKLGPNYSRTASPLALPATLESDGCTATTSNAGDTLIDIPAPNVNLYTQDDPAILAIQVNEAANAGLSGFVVSWSGNGQAAQTSSSNVFNKRLDALVNAVNKFNDTHAQEFHLIIGYQGLDNARNPRSDSWIMNDWQYFVDHYETNPVFQLQQYSAKPIFMLLDSRKFPVADIAAITTPYRSSLFLLGDEHGVTEWNRGVSSYFDGAGWYFSSQNPYTNVASFNQLNKLSNLLKSQGKLWFSPLSAGYNKSNFNLGGGCVPRKDGQTLQLNYAGNKASNPDGWMYISWNEFLENTYLEPSVLYGNFYLQALQAIISKQN